MNFIFLFIMAIVLNTSLIVKSPAFSNNDFIPSKYTCEGLNINPALTLKKIPEHTKSLAIIMDDPDAPAGTFVHWVMWNIPPTEKIEENKTPGVVGVNGKNENKYAGPCPPNGTHHYHFKIYALDTNLDIPINSDKKALVKAMDGHIMDSGELIGVYKKSN